MTTLETNRSLVLTKTLYQLGFGADNKVRNTQHESSQPGPDSYRDKIARSCRRRLGGKEEIPLRLWRIPMTSWSCC